MNCVRRLTSAAIAAFLLVAYTGVAQDSALSGTQVEHPAVHGHRLTVPREPAVLPQLCAACVRSNLEYLAGPELHGRGSGTEDEHHTAEFIAGKLKQYGLEPAAENGDYIQAATIASRNVLGTPTLSLAGNQDLKQGATVWAHGKDIAFLSLASGDAAGPLQKLDGNDPANAAAVREGAAVVLKLKDGLSMADAQKAVKPFLASKAAIVIMPVLPDAEPTFKSMRAHPPRTPKKFGSEAAVGLTEVLAGKQAFDYLWKAAEGTRVEVHAELSPWQETHTWNVLAKVPGDHDDQIILLSAHLDHLGVVKGKTYPGADDDASGTVAVMELARALAKEPSPRRTVVVSLWGSEEAGMLGARYFLQNPTFDLKDIVANLEFEMIARADPQVKPDQLWLTGWERTNLGPELAQQGAKLVGDPHPDQNFFARSDNYALAQKGIVAQTVSSYGLHQDYHQPTDTLSRVNWTHLDEAIGSMIGPVTWLADSEFVPQWKEGGKP